jgi:hypothetical protein
MQAITVTYLPPTNCRGARLKASCERGSVTIPYPHGAQRDAVWREAFHALAEKFAAEDEAKYGTPREQNPWLRPAVEGWADGKAVFVFLPTA